MMSRVNASAPAATGALVSDYLAGESPDIVAQTKAPEVAGRIEVFRGHRRWHRAVIVVCPNCDMPHLHWLPWRRLRSVQRTAPCGVQYVILVRAGEVDG